MELSIKILKEFWNGRQNNIIDLDSCPATEHLRCNYIMDLYPVK